jgi:hypothetical protein
VQGRRSETILTGSSADLQCKSARRDMLPNTPIVSYVRTLRLLPAIMNPQAISAPQASRKKERYESLRSPWRSGTRGQSLGSDRRWGS